ncbi:MAG: PIN domain-containing protein [Candidatus Micrarchaeaceae archaeon]|jgi:predicted nucleic acid-binding protein
MKLVVDANVVMAALVKPSITREVLLYPYIDYYSPSYLLEEIKDHEGEIATKAGKGYKEALKTIMKKLIIVRYDSYKERMAEAKKIIGNIDKDDVQYIALSLALDADGIWSYDGGIKKQNVVEVFSTGALISLIRSGIV